MAQLARERPEAFFKRCDAKYEQKIDEICTLIASDTARSRIIMLSGPSSSAKTTTSLKLRARLLERGVRAVALSLDDFFKNRDDAPTLPDGSKDYESISSLDVDLLHECLSDLTERGAAELPVFDFKTGTRAAHRRSVTLAMGEVAIVEGLHALDSTITGAVPEGHCLKVYVSVSSDFVDDAGAVVLSARDVRLIRRTIRDYKYRNSSPENTLSMWPAVCRGEDLYVRPFKRYSDITVNSIFECEPCLFRGAVTRLFSRVPETDPHFDTAQRLLAAIRQFHEMSPALMPETCVLREFSGHSVYYRKDQP